MSFAFSMRIELLLAIDDMYGLRRCLWIHRHLTTIRTLWGTNDRTGLGKRLFRYVVIGGLYERA